MSKWNNLSMKLRHELMKVYMSNGMMKLLEMKNHYNMMEDGGDVNPGMTGMMKARMALASEFGNPTARRMTNMDGRSYTFTKADELAGGDPAGSKGNVYVSSYDNLITPLIQDINGELKFIPLPWSRENYERSYNQSIKFDRPEDARYFGEHYKEIAPMMNRYAKGGLMNQQNLHMNVDGDYWNLHLTHYNNPFKWWNEMQDGGRIPQLHANVISGSTYWNLSKDGGNLFGDGGFTIPVLYSDSEEIKQVPYNSQEYRDIYPSLTSYNALEDTYNAGNLPLLDVKANNWVAKAIHPGTYTDPVFKPLVRELYTNPIPFRLANLPDPTYHVALNVENPKSNFGIVDKSVDSIYYFNKNRELLLREPIIRGADEGTIMRGFSMKDLFEKNDTDDHAVYFNYLKDNGLRVTPEGIFTLSALRENTAENPDKYGKFINHWFRPSEEKLIKNIRLRDYGSQLKLFTLLDENGVAMSNAVHGTDNPDREAVFNNAYASTSDRNMSNGCINVDDASCIFNVLKPLDKLVVTSEDDWNLSYDLGNKPKYSQMNNIYSKEKKVVYNALLQRGIPKEELTEDLLNFIVTTGEKESKFGRSKYSLAEDYLPHFVSHSQGDFQINPDSFKDYLPEDYNESKPETQMQALYNFYKKNINKATLISLTSTWISGKRKYTQTPNQTLYGGYNTGSMDYSSDAVEKFGEIEKSVSKVK